MPVKEARIADQVDTDQTARVIVRLLRGCVTYQFPYVQRHEFESLLFSDITEATDYFGNAGWL